LSESFIEKFKEYVTWKHIRRFQNASKEFLKKHKGINKRMHKR